MYTHTLVWPLKWGSMDSLTFVWPQIEVMDSEALSWPLEEYLSTPGLVCDPLESKVASCTTTLHVAACNWGYVLPHLGMAPKWR